MSTNKTPLGGQGKLAILIPTVRWNPRAKALLATCSAIANDEITVIIGNNCQLGEKKDFLKQLSQSNPNIIAITHPEDIGAAANLYFLYEQSKSFEYCALIGDDDWMTPCYFPGALESLKENPAATCCETGTALADLGDGEHIDISQPSMTGTNMLERLEKWSAINARVTMYNASRRVTIDSAINYLRRAPLHGLTLAENLWELNRLALGDFVRTKASSYFIHYPDKILKSGDSSERFYNLLCRDVGLSRPALNFMDLSSAIQCAIFLMGKLSPLHNAYERQECAQAVFQHIYTKQFLPKFQTPENKAKILASISDAALMRRVLEFISPPFAVRPVIHDDLIKLFIDLIEHFQVDQSKPKLTPKLTDFFNEMLPQGIPSPTTENIVFPCNNKTTPSFISNKAINTPGKELYDQWREMLGSLKQFQAKISNPPSQFTGNLLSIVVHAPLDWLHLLANTIDSLAGHTSPQWHLIVVTTIDSPEELESIDRILWINETEPAVMKHAIDGMVGQIDSRWVMEIPCGTLIDEDLVRHLEEIDQERVKAVFCDDDLYNESGKRFSPRFKPGVNPEALLSSDLAGPLCVDTKAWLLNGGTWLAGYTPWFEKLLTISERYGWKAIHHRADILLSHHPETRTHAKSCLLALEQHLETKYPEANFIMANDGYWSVHYPLPAPPPSVDIFIYSMGDLGLINRCLQSIKENTDYPDFRIGIILESHESDPDLDAWIAAYTEANPTSLVIRSKTQTSFPTLANQAISSSRASYSLFINDESVAIHKEWLEELIRPCCQQNVAGASPRLIKPGSGLIENAGYILGLCSWRASPYQGKSNDEKREGFDWLDCARDVTTLCPACFLINNAHAISAGLMDQEGFFDQTALADLSLRLFDQGLRLLYIPRANLVGSSEPPVPLHAPFKEQADFILDRKKNQDTFSQRWWPRFAHDPFWNQNLVLNELVPTLETEFMPDWFFRDDGKPRILAHVLANAQADFRITDPLRALRRQNKVATCVWEQRVFKAPRFHTASELYRLNPDVHIVQHYIHDDALAAMNTWRGLSHRPFTVYALDDAVTDIDPKSPFFKNFAANARTRLKYALARADRMVVSTDFLAELYKNLISDIQVVPNRLEMEKWLSLRTAKRTSSKPRIGWAGGTTHQRDLSLLKEVIEQTRDEADWIFFGMCPDEILPLVKETYPFMSFDEYPTFLASLNFDIAVAPLAETVFNRGKSNLRLLEYGILGLPVVCTDIEPYRNSPACRVRNNADHWVSALRERIHDADAREAEGRAMRRWVQEKYLLENHLDEWLLAHTPN